MARGGGAEDGGDVRVPGGAVIVDAETTTVMAAGSLGREGTSKHDIKTRKRIASAKKRDQAVTQARKATKQACKHASTEKQKINQHGDKKINEH